MNKKNFMHVDEMKNDVFEKFFERDTGKEERIQTYTERLRSVHRMIPIMAVLSIIYLVSATYSLGLERALTLFWSRSWLVEYVSDLSGDFSEIMAYTMGMSRIALFIGFAWMCKNTLMHLAEAGYKIGMALSKLCQETAKAFSVIPVCGAFVTVMMMLFSLVTMMIGPFAYSGLMIFIGTPFWVLFAVYEHFSLKREIKKI